MKFSGFLTDLDNTLYDFASAMEKACQAVIRVSGTGEYEGLLQAFLFSPHGVESIQVIVDYLNNLGIKDDILLNIACNEFEKIKDESIVPYPGVIHSIIRIHNAGIRIGGVTNASSVYAWSRIDHLGLREYFSVLSSPDLTGVRKPDPMIYLKAAVGIDCSPSQICVLGDNLVNDIAPAQILGMMGVHARYGNRLPAEFSKGVIADMVIDSFAEIEDVLGILQ